MNPAEISILFLIFTNFCSGVVLIKQFAVIREIKAFNFELKAELLKFKREAYLVSRHPSLDKVGLFVPGAPTKEELAIFGGGQPGGK